MTRVIALVPKGRLNFRAAQIKFKKHLRFFVPATTFHVTVALSFVIPSEAEGSAVPRNHLETRHTMLKQTWNPPFLREPFFMEAPYPLSS